MRFLQGVFRPLKSSECILRRNLLSGQTDRGGILLQKVCRIQGWVLRKLYRAGANVIVNSPLTDTHTSGHASEEELKLMLVLTKPKYFMPIHGEYAMLYKHKQLAISTGVEKDNCFVLENGHVLTFNENGVFLQFGNTKGATPSSVETTKTVYIAR